eukprot:722064-Hanusia_phi.AAC.1
MSEKCRRCFESCVGRNNRLFLNFMNALNLLVYNVNGEDDQDETMIGLVDRSSAIIDHRCLRP